MVKLPLLALIGHLMLDPVAADAVTLTRGPYLQLGTSSSVILRWRTDTATDSEVRYGSSPDNLTASVFEPTSVTEHEVLVTGLAAATRYYYSIGSSTQVLAGEDGDHYVDTSPLLGTGASVRVWVLGDSGTADSNAAAVRDAFLAYPNSDDTDLVVLLGDNAYNDGTDSEYQDAVFDMYPSILRNTVFWSTLGNHDGHSADSDTESGPYYDIFTLPRAGEAGGLASGTEAYYSFDYANSHFICLDSYDSDRSQAGDMLTWMAQDLAATTQDWIIAFWHHPPYTKGSHDSDSEGALIEMRQNAVELLEDFGVDLVLSGHSHSYERSFLLDGHYGDTGSFVESMKVDGGDGREDGDGAYNKAALSHQGAVYAVAGSSGKISGGALNHPAMFVSINQLGSMVLDISANRLDAVFLRENGSTPDSFTILKGPDIFPPQVIGATATGTTTVEVEFDEPLEQASAETSGNYTIDLGVLVVSATLLGDARTVELTTTNLSESVTYTLDVSAVTDAAGNPVAPGEQTQFSWLNSIVLSFQDGAFPDAAYSGTRDTYLEEALASENNGSSTMLLVDGDDGSNNDLTTLIRWDITAIPVGAIVTEASVEVEVFNPSSDDYELYQLLTSWIEDEATWSESENGNAWDSPGAAGVSDRGPDVLGVINAGSTGAHLVPLNTQGLAAVQGWIADPSSNRGIVIADKNENDGLDFYSREAGPVDDRPKLIVTYYLPAEPDTEPPSIPTGLEVTGVGPDFVSLAWNASTDNVAVAFYVAYREGVEIDTTHGTSYTDSTVQPDTSYVYRVESVDTSGNPSGLSPSAAVTTDPECLAPDGDSLLLEAGTVSGQLLIEVCTTITAENDYVVEATGDLTLRAGSGVNLGNGFSVMTGGGLAVDIDPALGIP